MATLVKSKSARQLALESLYMIEHKGEFAKKALEEVFKNPLSSVDKSLIMEIVYGVLRHRKRLDWIIETQIERGIEKIDPWVRNNLRMGAYQIIFLERVPEWAAVNESVELAKVYGHTGVAGLVNVVLRNIIRNKEAIKYPYIEEDPVLHISVLYSHPGWLVRKWIKRFGVDETISLCKANNEIPPLTVRTNTLLISREELLKKLREEVKDAEATHLSPCGIRIKGYLPITELESYKKGYFQIQDEGAQLIAPMLEPKRGERVLDACAGMGGKATHIAEIMRDDGEIVAIDINDKRLKLLRENIERLGINIIKVLKADATENLNYLGKFDSILIDAPCSALGVLRRYPEGKWRKTEEIIKEFQGIQLSIIKSVSSVLKSGGKLVFCTCSTEPEEGEEVVQSFLEENPDFYLDNPFSALSVPLESQGILKGLRVYPHIHNTDGFFAVRIGRV